MAMSKRKVKEGVPMHDRYSFPYIAQSRCGAKDIEISIEMVKIY